MNDDSRELDQLVRTWWLKGNEDKLFQNILERALIRSPANLVPYARALQILQTQQFRPSIQQRVDELARHLDRLKTRESQADILGDVNNEPQALFAVLGTEVENLQGFDTDSLRRARLSQPDSRGRAAQAFFEALGWDRLRAEAVHDIRQAVDDIIDREQYQAWGLFVAQGESQGLALGVKLILCDSGQELFSDADNEMRDQARLAAKLGLQGQGWDARIEWPAHFVGESIGLPLYVAALVAQQKIPAHALTACTGRLDIDGSVTAVTGIQAKVEAARRIGMRRVLIPRENIDIARTAAGDHLLVLPVDHVNDVLSALRQPMSPIEIGFAELVMLVRASAREYQLIVQNENDTVQGRQFVVANAAGTARIWVYNNGGVRAEGPSGPALDAAKRLISERVPPAPEPRETLSFQLPTGQLREGYRTALQAGGAVDDAPHQHEAWRMQLPRGKSRATVVMYNSGKCVIQGTAPAWEDVRELADSITKNIGGLPRKTVTAKVGPTNQATTEDKVEPHIGTDEAGKGDYFGPLVSAAVFVDAETAVKLRELGVRDSKTLSDRRIAELAEKIRSMPTVRGAVVPINPRKYNDLYEQFRREGKNLNSLLAWGHARSIDAVLSAPLSKRVNAKYVIVDQFADKRYIEQRTQKFGIPIYQRPKAEEDIAVAAASVLARDGFVKWIDRMSERTQVRLPKGASPQVIEAAKEFVRRWGAKWLREVAKLNFRTTEQVLDGEDKHVDRHPPKWIGETAE